MANNFTARMAKTVYFNLPIFSLTLSRTADKSSIWLGEFHYFTRIKHNQLFEQAERIYYYACSWRLWFDKKKRERINWNQICCISHRETQWSSTMILGRKHEICSAQPNYNISHVSNENCAKRWFHELLRHATRLWNYSISFSCSNRYVVSSDIFNQQRDMWVFESQHWSLFAAFFHSLNDSSLSFFICCIVLHVLALNVDYWNEQIWKTLQSRRGFTDIFAPSFFLFFLHLFRSRSSSLFISPRCCTRVLVAFANERGEKKTFTTSLTY